MVSELVDKSDKRVKKLPRKKTTSDEELIQNSRYSVNLG